MVDVAFKDLCLDVTAGDGMPESVTRFWAGALDLAIAPAGGEDSVLRPHVVDHGDGGDREQRTIWVNAVPEPRGAKARVHLDLRVPGGDPTPLLELGASLLRAADAAQPWHVLADPDGIELCVFDESSIGSGRTGIYELVTDAADPEEIALWWSARTGATVHRHPERPFVWLEGVAGFPFERWEFNPVPEPKTVKNRIHWDVDLVDASVDDLVGAGATLLREPTEDAGWTVLEDPEGNEFCAFAPMAKG